MDERESKIIIRVQGKDTPRCPACAGSTAPCEICPGRAGRYRSSCTSAASVAGMPTANGRYLPNDCRAVAVPRARETQRRCEILQPRFVGKSFCQRVENCAQLPARLSENGFAGYRFNSDDLTNNLRTASIPAHIKGDRAHINGDQLEIIRLLLTLTANKSGSEKRSFGRTPRRSPIHSWESLQWHSTSSFGNSAKCLAAK
jgi:hypothetical protein